MYYFLDRNYIIEIDKFLAGKNHDVETVEKARELDVKGNFISSLTSVFEGSNCSTDGEGVREDVLREANVLIKFFKYARTDGAHLNKNSLEAILALQDHRKNEAKNELDSFVKIKKFLGCENSKVDSWNKFNDLIEFKKNCEYVWGMAYIAAAASIFGHQGARDVLKLNRSSTAQLEYNSYSDLKIISLIGRLEHQAIEFSGNKDLKFILQTNDKGLINFRNSCVFNKVELRDRLYGGEVKFSIDLKKFVDDLPFVSINRKEELISKLGSF